LIREFIALFSLWLTRVYHSEVDRVNFVDSCAIRMYTSGFSKLAVVCPCKNCKGADGILLPLIETPLDQYNFAVQCPYCLAHLLTCENCQALLEDVANEEHRPSPRSGVFSPIKFSAKARVSKAPERKLQDELHYQICRKCGFFNPIHLSLRQALDLNVIRPWPYATVRLYQRCIAEAMYLEFKVKELAYIKQYIAENRGSVDSALVTPSKKRARTLEQSQSSQKKQKTVTQIELNLTRDNNNNNKAADSSHTDPLAQRLNLLQAAVTHVTCTLDDLEKSYEFQLESIQDLEVRSEDLKFINNMHFKEQSRGFTRVHLKMLKSLHEDGELSQDERTIFEQVDKFLDKQSEIIKIKFEAELAATVCRRAKHATAIQAPVTVPEYDIDAHAMLNNILTHRLERMTTLLRYWSQPYLELLVAISTELKHLQEYLLQQLRKQYRDSSDQHQFNLALFGADASTILAAQSKVDVDQFVTALKTKIHLWRNLYRTVSSTVL
jgi:hypothetical protein